MKSKRKKFSMYIGIALLLMILPGQVFASNNEYDLDELTTESQELIQNYKSTGTLKEVDDNYLSEEFTENKMNSVISTNGSYVPSKTFYFKRGSALMWSKDYVNFSYTGSSVTRSNGWQETGFIFPNIIRKAGISRYNTTSYTHYWKGTKTIGAGVPTPRGDVKAYDWDITDYFRAYGSGNYSVN